MRENIRYLLGASFLVASLLLNVSCSRDSDPPASMTSEEILLQEKAAVKRMDAESVSGSVCAHRNYVNGEKHVTVVVMWGWSNEVIRELKNLPYLKKVRVESPTFDREGLGQILALKNVRSLALVSELTDADLALIGKVDHLKEFSLESKIVTDIGLAKLPKNLQSLWLNRCNKISDAGLAKLPENLQSLWLYRCNKISGAGLAKLPNNMQSLSLCGCENISDAGMAAIVNLEHLVELDIRRTGVTDQGLLPLAKLKNLRKLDVQETAVTEAGVKKLKSLLPQLEINL